MRKSFRRIGPEAIERDNIFTEIFKNYEIQISTEELLPEEKQVGTVVGLGEATTIALDVGALACSKKIRMQAPVLAGILCMYLRVLHGV
jgi:hypothetical protein